jgi:hypothetical protein
MPVPKNLEFKPHAVPSGYIDLVRLTPRPHGAYFRRTFDLPGDAATGGKTGNG